MISCSHGGTAGLSTRGGDGIPPEPPAPIVGTLWFAEGTLASSQKIEIDPQRKKVAARIAALSEHLLGRDIGAGSNRALRFLLHQIGQLIVPRQPEIDQHRIVAT